MQSIDVFQDPKTAFLLSLVKEMDQASFELKYGSKSQAAKNLSVIIDRLIISDKNEAMKKIREKISWNNISNLQDEDIKQAFREISQYLNRTYFKGFYGSIESSHFDELEEDDGSES
jgi:uncharacterized linocin/CFP29 family protein